MIRAHKEAVLAAAMAPDPNVVVYDADDVPPNPAYPYGVLTFSRRGAFGEARRLSDGSLTRAWRAVFLYVGQYADDARFVEEGTEIALENKRLTIPGYKTTPVHYESGRGVSRDPDIDDIYSGASTWTFVSTQQVA